MSPYQSLQRVKLGTLQFRVQLLNKQREKELQTKEL